MEEAIETAVDHNKAFCGLESGLARLFRHPLDEQGLDLISSLEIPCGGFGFDPVGFEGLETAKEFCSSGGGKGDVLRKASDDFHYLFVGPGKLGAAPWSSVYLDKGLLFGPSEQSVEMAMRSRGLGIPEGHREPCDHVAYELAFAGELHGRAAEFLEKGDIDAAQGEMAACLDFVRTYLQPWLPAFAEKVKGNARTGLYPGLVDFVLSVVDWDIACTQELLKETGQIDHPAAEKRV